MKTILEIAEIAVFIGGVPLAFSLFLLFILNKTIKAMKLRESPNCKELIGYDENVEYEVLRQWVKTEKTTKNGNTNTRQTEIALVKMSCVCQKCGTSKQFNKEFILSIYDNGNLVSSYEVDYLVKSLFTGKFLQLK